MTKFYYASKSILTPKNEEEGGAKWAKLVAITFILLPLISTLEDIKNEEVDSPFNINETCEDSEIKLKTLEPLSEAVVLREAVLKISLPLTPSILKYT